MSTHAQLTYPSSVFVSNGEVYIADTLNFRIRKVLHNGQIVTICGTGEKGYNGDDQPATLAQLNQPSCIAVSSRHEVYISDWGNQRIRKICRDGMITTIAGTGQKGFNGDGQLATQAQLDCPNGLFITDQDEVLFADFGNHRIRMIESNGMMKTIAGTGKRGYNGDDILATEAQLNYPSSVFKYGNELYISNLETIDQKNITKWKDHNHCRNR